MLRYRTIIRPLGMWIIQGVYDVPASCCNWFTHPFRTLTAASTGLLLPLLVLLLPPAKRFSHAQRTVTYIRGHGHPTQSRNGSTWPAPVVCLVFAQPNDHMAIQQHYLHTSRASYKQKHSSQFESAELRDTHRNPCPGDTKLTMETSSDFVHYHGRPGILHKDIWRRVTTVEVSAARTTRSHV